MATWELILTAMYSAMATKNFAVGEKVINVVANSKDYCEAHTADNAIALIAESGIDTKTLMNFVKIF
jgi:hypothetical protein